MTFRYLILSYLSLFSISYGIDEGVLQKYLPEGYESYLSRPNISEVKPKAGKNLEPVWKKMKSSLPATLAQLLEAYPDRQIYFLARDGEFLYDYAKVTLSPDEAKRVKLINVSRGNMDDPHLKDYLAQEGISEKSLRNGEKALFVDTGFSGTISRKIEELFHAKYRKQLQTHLMLSETSRYPSTHAFVSGLSEWATYLTPEDIHGKLVALEHLPHSMARSTAFQKIADEWHPISKIGDESERSLIYQQDLHAFANTPENIEEFKRYRKIWQNLFKIEATGDRKSLKEYLKKIIAADSRMIAIALDYIELTKTNRQPGYRKIFSRSDIGIAEIPENVSAKINLIKKESPEWSEVFDNPKEAIPKLVAEKKIGPLIELMEFIPQNEVYHQLIKELGKEPGSQYHLEMIRKLVELSKREILEDLPVSIFSKPHLVKYKEFNQIIERFITLSEEDAQDDLIKHFYNQPHSAKMTGVKESLRYLLSIVDEESLEYLKETLNKPHYQGSIYEKLRAVAHVDDLNERKRLLSKKNHKSQGVVPEGITESKKKSLFNFTPPNLSTDEARLKWLMHVRNHVPELFAQSAKYDINLMALLEDQEKLQAQLVQDSEYLENYRKEHPELLSIEIAPKSNESIKSYKISSQALKAWKEELLSDLSLIESADKFDTELTKQMSTVMTDLDGKSVNGLITGLAMSLSPADKSEVFKAQGFQAKLDILKEKLPRVIDSGFRYSTYGFSKAPSKDEILKVVVDVQKLEEKFKKLVTLDIILQENSGEINPSMEENRNKIKNFEASNLDHFTDMDAIRPRVDKLIQRLSQYGVAKIDKKVAKQFQEKIKSFSSQTEEITEALDKGIRLEEVTPAVGIFRGCTGGDCSTQHSFPYPNGVEEHVFYVYDSEDKLKGYVSSVVVNGNGKRSLYPITIAGPRISSSDTTMILEGLNRAKEAFKVEQIILPSGNNISDLINYTSISSVYKSSSLTDSEIKVDYLYKYQRSIIENAQSKYNHGNYDSMKKNDSALLYRENTEAKLPLSVNITMKAEPEFSGELKRIDVLEFVQDLKRFGRVNQVDRVLSAGGIDPAVYHKAIDSVSNPGRLPIEKFLKNVKKSTSKLVGNNSRFTLGSTVLFEGYANSPDFADYVLQGKLSEEFLVELFNTDSRNLQLALDKAISNLNAEKRLMFYEKLLDINDPAVHQKIITSINKEEMNDWKTIIKRIVDEGDPTSLRHLVGKLSYLDGSDKLRDGLLETIIYRGDPATLNSVISVYFKDPKSSRSRTSLNVIIERADDSVYESLLNNVFTENHSKKWGKELQRIIQNASPEAFEGSIPKIFAEPHTEKWNAQFKLAIDKLNDKGIANLLEQMDSFEQDRQDYLEKNLFKLAQKGGPLTTEVIIDDELINLVSKKDRKKLLNIIIEKADDIGLSNLADKFWEFGGSEADGKMIMRLVESDYSAVHDSLVNTVFSSESSAQWGTQLSKLIDRIDPLYYSDFFEKVFSQPHSEKWGGHLSKLIDKSVPGDLEGIADNVFGEQHSSKWTKQFITVLEKINPVFLDDFTLARADNLTPEEVKVIIKLGDESVVDPLMDSFFSERKNQKYQSLMKSMLVKFKHDKDLMESIAEAHSLYDEGTLDPYMKTFLEVTKTEYLEQLGPDREVVRNALSELNKKSSKEKNAKKSNKRKLNKEAIQFAGQTYKPGEVVLTPAGEEYIIVEEAGRGKRGVVYKAETKDGKFVALKVAIDNSIETKNSFEKELKKNKQYAEAKVPHAKIIESGPELIVKEYIDGVRADKALKAWEAKGYPKDDTKMKQLASLISSLSNKSMYFGDLNSENLIWHKKKWVIVDSGSLQRRPSKEDALKKFMASIPRKWGEKVSEPDKVKSCISGLLNGLVK